MRARPSSSAGRRLGGAELGALAAVGRPEVACARRPRLALLLTGDELVEPGEPLGPGQIRDSNAYAVPPLAADAGAEVTSVEIAPDHLEGTVAALDRALGADVVVVCGGVSVGEHDHVRPALEQLGVEQVFWRVSLRPGKPTYFGVGAGGKLVFGLPGNPVSAMVTFLLFVRPALLAMQGGEPLAGSITARITEDYEKVSGPRGGDPGQARRRRPGLGRDPDRPAGLPRPHLDARRRRTGDRPHRDRGAARGRPRRRRAAARVAFSQWPRQRHSPDEERTVTVAVRLFAILRERAGEGQLTLELPAAATVADALAELAQRPGLGEALDRIEVAIAVNREWATRETALEPGDELALIPPVSGGSGDVHARVTDEPLELDPLARMVVRDAAGAVVTFAGVTREVERLEYEAYAEMAEERMAAILAECVATHGLEAAAAEHRTGSVPLGEPSVIVAVSAGHRGEAFAGAREAIDRIKAEAPIWKQEVDGGESRWVEGTVPKGATSDG